MLDRLWNALTSTRLALTLFIIIACTAVVGTLPGMETLCHHPAFSALLAFLGLNTVLCTVKRWKGLAWPVLVVHGGVIIVLLGGVATRFGFIATVNVYEGDTVNQAYRWDKERDEPLGFDMTVASIKRDYYPVPIKVGLLRGEEKAALFTLKTGESFSIDGYSVKVESLDVNAKKLHLTVSGGGQVIGKADTEEKWELPSSFPYRFKLVAFQNPKLKRIWVDLRLTDKGRLLAEGVSEVNGPLHWNELSIFNTQVTTDAGGRSYAGIQIVKDPGRPIAFAGFVITALGTILSFMRRFLWQ